MNKMKGGSISLKDLLIVWFVLIYYMALGLVIVIIFHPLMYSFVFFTEHLNDYLIIIFR